MMVRDCPHTYFQPRKRTKSNGVVCVTRQCEGCGKSMGEVSKTGFNLDEIEWWDQDLVDRSEAESEAYYKRQRELHEAKQTDWWKDYTAYLKSEHWWNTRAAVLRRDPICQVCFTNCSAQAHHLSYESFCRYGMSFSVDCVGVCVPCHDRLHGKEKSLGKIQIVVCDPARML